MLEVADCGPGIADDQKAKVFERFHVVAKKSQREPSRVLGLSIVKSIPQAHGGQTLVCDNLPHGAVLVLHLPITGAEVKEATARLPAQA